MVKTLRNLPPTVSNSNKVTVCLSIHATGKPKTLMSCNTHISIIISFKKTPSAKSVMDSIKALVLKVLLA